MLSQGFFCEWAANKDRVEKGGCIVQFEVVAIEHHLFYRATFQFESQCQCAASLYPCLAHRGRGVAGGLAAEELLIVVCCLNFSDGTDVCLVEDESVVCEICAYVMTKFFYANAGQCVLQQRHSALHALHTLRKQFCALWCQCSTHQSGVGVIEHSAMYYVAVGKMIEGIAAYLASTSEYYVIPSRNLHLCTQGIEARCHTLGIFLEKLLHAAFSGDEAGHDIALVGIYATSSAFPSDDIYALSTAEVLVNLQLCILMSAHNHGGRQLPCEQVVAFWEIHCQILFRCQIKRCPFLLVTLRKSDKGGREEGLSHVFCGVRLGLRCYLCPFLWYFLHQKYGNDFVSANNRSLFLLKSKIG